VLILLANKEFPLHVLLTINFIGWSSVCVLYISERNMHKCVDSTSDKLGFSKGAGSLETKLAKFLVDLERFATASFEFRPQGEEGTNNLWLSLYRIVLTTYNDLDAQAVELALFDDKSKLWTQAMLVGSPRGPFSQAMLLEGGQLTNPADFDDNGVITMAQPVSFAGTLFGCLRVELRKGELPSKEDRRILSLFATQGALMLVDSQFTDQLLRMRVAGEESTRAKTGFLANLSHEIRGPLGIILNGVELINDGLCGPVTESQRETLGMIKQNGDHLLDLVNDVLDYAKVEAGKIKAKPVKLKVGSLLTDLSNVVRSQSIAKKQDLKTDPVEKDLTLLCDKRHARQMLINLLTNAVKYTPLNGSIHISAERIPGNRIKITVADTGIGIPVAERSKVFGAFERVEDKYAQSQVGSGLGMPLTKRLAEVNKGTVDFESEQGVGSTFWLILPAAETVEEEEILGGTEKRQGVFARGRGEAILLVDRENDERDMLERYLAHQGFKVINAANGAEVLRTLREWPIDLAVVEYDLPDITGEEMVGMIRQNPAAADLPIVMLSSKAFVFDIERFLKLGVDRCLSKPVDLCEIADTARQLIDETKSIPT
jgi:signal transduction histidine kinase/CheY-like chemotaxis protein